MVGDEPLLALLRELGARDYDFIAVTPTTHARVLSRPVADAPSLRDIFGWNRPFDPTDLDAALLGLLEEAQALETVGERLRSKVRVASLNGSLFLHSSFPTEESDSVFFGPDTYRFTQFVRRHLPRIEVVSRAIDMGAGGGAGGIDLARQLPQIVVSLVDVNREALRLAAINAAYAGVPVELVGGSMMPAGADLVIANPPYMMDSTRRAYRDGGDLLGGGISLDWARQALDAMAPGGTMLLYTGAAYRRGRSPLLDALDRSCREAAATLLVGEIDPDVFGEELEGPAYVEVERIAAVGAVISKRKP